MVSRRDGGFAVEKEIKSRPVLHQNGVLFAKDDESFGKKQNKEIILASADALRTEKRRGQNEGPDRVESRPSKEDESCLRWSTSCWSTSCWSTSFMPPHAGAKKNVI